MVDIHEGHFVHRKYALVEKRYVSSSYLVFLGEILEPQTKFYWD